MKPIQVLGIIMLIAIAVSIRVRADPVPISDLGTPVDSRGDYSGLTALSDEAYAGNITSLEPNVTSITKTWQGYYGNITAKIVLDNANNKSMYDWDVANPTGTVFAVNDTITSWTDIGCFNFTDADDMNLTEYESKVLNCTGDDDGLNETFTSETHETVYVGTTSFTNECNATKTYVNDGQGAASFDEVLLYDKGEDRVIYATVIHADETNFENGQSDFQMIVGEDGHGGDTAKTTYYFYIELM